VCAGQELLPVAPEKAMFNKKNNETSEEQVSWSEPVIESQPEDAETAPSNEEYLARSVSYVGPGLQMSGNIVAEENLIIEGVAEGSIKCGDKQLTVGKKGRVSGQIVGNVIEVRGTVEGDIYSHEIVRLYPTAVVDGAIYCKRLVMDDKAVFNGSIDMNWDGAVPNEEPLTSVESDEKVVKAVG
jgi:cytoskeletal protein CcmA (bactofilin family)